MKILYFFAQYDSPMYHWQDYHLIDELKYHGIHIEIVNPLYFESIEEANEYVVKKLKNSGYDLFMTCNNESFCFKETLGIIKEMGVPTLLWCTDSLMSPYNHKSIISLFDLVMISQIDDTGFFIKNNPNIIVSHYAANPYFFKPDYNTRKIHRIAFPGTPYGSRSDIINTLAESGCELDLYYGSSSTEMSHSQINTANPKSHGDIRTVYNLMSFDVGRKVLLSAALSAIKNKKHRIIESDNVFKSSSVDLKRTNKIYADHDLSLSVSIARNTGLLKKPVHIVHLRNFEIPMSGGVQFCEFFPELAECFEEDKEIVFYRSREEMIEKAKYYTKPENEKTREKIRKNARIRAENEHTWYLRFSKAFDYLGLDY